MTINVKIADVPPEPLETAPPESPEPPKIPPLRMNLVLRKAVDGSLMILDHPAMDITVSKETNKVVAFPKNLASDDTYTAQSRLFRHLVTGGIIEPSSVEGGAVYGALEGAMFPPDNPKLPLVDIVVLSVGKFLEKEMPDYAFSKAYDQEIEDMYVDPSDLETTPLGKVPQANKKGNISPYDARMYLMGLY